MVYLLTQSANNSKIKPLQIADSDEIEPLTGIADVHYNFQIPLELVKSNQFSLIRKGW